MSEAARREQLALPAPDAGRSLTLPVVDAPLDPLDGISKKLMVRAEAKAEIVAAFRAVRNRSCLTLNVTGEKFVARYNSEIERVSTATRELYPTIEWPSLQRDWRRFEKSGIAGLVPGYKGGKRIIDSNPSMRDLVIAQIAHNPRVRARFVLDGLKVRFPNDRLPDLRSVERFIRDWTRQNRSLFQRIVDPDGARNKDMLAIGAMDAGISRVGQLVEIDGSPADCYVLCTDSSPGGRLHLLVAIDVHSRRMVAHLAPVESSDALAALLAKAIPILGVPDAIRHDNGAGFVSARTQRALARMGISSIRTPAYRGDRKPFIERGIGTILHSFFENVPGFIGHSVVEASQIRKRNGHAPGRGERRNMRKLYRIELTAPQLQEMLDQWLDHVYGDRKHSTLGRTPNEVFGEGDRRGQVRRVADDRLLDLLLGEDGIAVISKKGLRVASVYYWHDDLAEHVGKTVQFVRTRDAGKLIVYTADTAPRFVCVATNPEALGLDREVMAIAGKQRQNAIMREGMEELRALKRKHRPERLYQEIIDNAVARGKAAIPSESNIETLPYRSPALKAAAAALEALDAPAESAPHSEEELREGERAIEAMEQRRAAREADLSDDELWNLWKAIRRAGRALNEREHAFLARFGNTAESWAISYESTSEYRAGLQIEKWDADEGQSHDKGNIPCARKSA
jgi:putative transposase